MKKEYRETFTMIYEILMICQEENIIKSTISRRANLGGIMTKFYVGRLLELNYLYETESGKSYGNGKVMHYKTTPAGLNFATQIKDWVELSKKKTDKQQECS